MMMSLPTIKERLYPELPSTSSFTSRRSLISKTPDEDVKHGPHELGSIFSTITVEDISTTNDAASRDIWYQISILSGSFEWTIHKKLRDILFFDWNLRLYKSTKMLEKKNEFGDDSISKPKRMSDISGLAFFSISREKSMSEHIKIVVGDLLNHILTVDAYRKYSTMLDFFEISKYSFRPELGEKGKEGFLEKRSSCCLVKNTSWNKRWFIVKKTFLMYLDPLKINIEGVFLFDPNTTLVHRNDKIAVKNSSHRILLKCPGVYQATLWKSIIESNIAELKDFYHKNSYESIVSFSPIRNARAHWFVDGCDYFSAVADAMLSADKEIFISGWFLAPHVYLKRGPVLEDKWMLKSILKKKADEGVKINILLYDAPDKFLKLADRFVEETLEELNKDNISVLRHRGKIIFWTHHEKLVVVDQCIAFVSGIDLTFGRWDFEDHPLTDLGNSLEESDETLQNGQLWPGVDYANEYVSSAVDFMKPFEDHFDRLQVHRIPWHDIACVTYDDAANDVARHFIQTWNFVKATKHRKEDKTLFLVPNVTSNSIDTQFMIPGVDVGKAHVQVVRSSTDWTTGIKETESSIHQAYIKSIGEAECYIYIENQFFISYQNQEIVKNGIVSALCRRIKRAAEEKKKFRVFIVLPLIPMLEGDFSKADKSQNIQVIANYQYKSISRGDETSLIGALQKSLSGKEINEYVCFSALRTHGELGGKMISELIYVHSKLMIVDDRLAIIGSANINDRSLLGARDSEVDLFIKDTEMIDSTMDGQPYEVGKFASGLRKKIFAEYLGLKNEESSEVLNDILADKFYHDFWKSTGRTNTSVYNEVFRCIPVDIVRRFSQVSGYQNKPTDEKEKSLMLKKVKGYLVDFPKQYLEDEDLPDGQGIIIPTVVYI